MVLTQSRLEMLNPLIEYEGLTILRNVGKQPSNAMSSTRRLEVQYCQLSCSLQ